MSLRASIRTAFRAAVLATLMMAASGMAVTSTASATVAPVGAGYVEIIPSCEGKAELKIVAYNDVEGSAPIDFAVNGEVNGAAIYPVSLLGVEYGSFITSGITIVIGDSYNLTATGPGYNKVFTGTYTCEQSLVVVTPTAPTSVDKAGTKDDTYTVPSMDGVDYLVDGNVVTAGPYLGTGSVTVVAKAKSGYMLNGTATWTFEFTNVVIEQPPVVVTPPVITPVVVPVVTPVTTPIVAPVAAPVAAPEIRGVTTKRSTALPLPIKVQTDGGQLSSAATNSGNGIQPLFAGGAAVLLLLGVASSSIYVRRREARN